MFEHIKSLSIEKFARLITIESNAVDIDYQFDGENEIPYEKIYSVYKTIDGYEFFTEKDAIKHTILVLNKAYETR